ncbi:MAG: hypothetical protein KDC40_12345 [Actinobacteria bacterium]|nr:hypothetical protein [Actinomycetota bacterium]MCB0920282.1 hypothetical protein [Actinomycetota bacterium]HRY08347.1 hypothetical protein [Candidatus Nanopelagicales bacterium]
MREYDDLADTFAQMGGAPVDDEPPFDRDDNGERRPPLEVTNASVAAKQLRAKLGTGPTSGVFARAGELVFTPHINEAGYQPLHLEDDHNHDSEVQIRAMTGIRLAAELDHRYDVFRFDKEGRAVPALAPLTVTTRLVAAPDNSPKVRPLTSVTRAPFVRPDWSICTKPGYDRATQVLYLPRGPQRITVSSRPSGHDLDQAVQLLMLMVGDFPWNSPDDRANYLAAMIWPVIAQTHNEALPALMINAHQPGSGKTLLGSILTHLYDGTMRSEWPTSKDEQEKDLAAIFAANTGGIVLYDNIKGTLRSGVLEGLLTTRRTSFRRLGTNDERIPINNDRLIVFTGNNIGIAGDLSRRVVWASIDPQMPDPETRSGFSIPGDLGAWVVSNRHRVVGAILTLVSHWVAEGRPMTSSRTDSFASSIDTAQGILSAAGIPGTVGAASAIPVAALDEQDEWSGWLEALHGVYGDNVFRAGELLAMLNRARASEMNPMERHAWEQLPEEVAVRWDERSGMTSRSLGMFLKNRNGRYFGDFAVRLIQDQRNGNGYQISKYAGPQ